MCALHTLSKMTHRTFSFRSKPIIRRPLKSLSAAVILDFECTHRLHLCQVTFATVAEEVARIDDYIRLTLYGKKNGSFLAQPSFSLQEPDNDRILMTVPCVYVFMCLASRWHHS